MAGEAGADAQSTTGTSTADADGVNNGAADAVANTGSDEPKTYTADAYNALKDESIGRRKEIETLKENNQSLTGQVGDLTGKVKSLTQIITGDESADADVDPKAIAEQSQAQTQKLETAMEMTLKKGTFLTQASKLGFHDNEVVFGMIKDDPRINASIITQTVDGMSDVLTEFAKSHPWAVAPKGDNATDVSPANADVKAPGTPPPTKQPASETQKDALADLRKRADEHAKKNGSSAGALFYLDELDKLKQG